MTDKDVTTLADLHQDKTNARRHNPRNIGMVVDALHEVGAARSGVIDEDGRILAGNATWEALAQAGIERVKVVDAEGDEWVVVRRSGLSERQKKRLSYFDNRSAELADWNVEQIAADLAGGLDLDGLFYENELEELLADSLAEAPEDFPEYDKDIETEHRCPKCGYEWSGQSR